jgi:hypothetical protein
VEVDDKEISCLDAIYVDFYMYLSSEEPHACVMFQRKLEDEFFFKWGCLMFIFGKNKNKENIKNNIGAAPLDQNFTNF